MNPILSFEEFSDIYLSRYSYKGKKAFTGIVNHRYTLYQTMQTLPCREEVLIDIKRAEYKKMLDLIESAMNL